MLVPNADGWKRGTKEGATAGTAVGAVQAEDARYHGGETVTNEATSRAG